MLSPLPADEELCGRPHLSASRLLERRREFNRSLVNIVKQHHAVSPCSLSLGGALGATRRIGVAPGMKDVTGPWALWVLVAGRQCCGMKNRGNPGVSPGSMAWPRARGCSDAVLAPPSRRSWPA